MDRCFFCSIQQPSNDPRAAAAADALTRRGLSWRCPRGRCRRLPLSPHHLPLHAPARAKAAAVRRCFPRRRSAEVVAVSSSSLPLSWRRSSSAGGRQRLERA
uniref:Uncharacterized protein n=1 Tax=Oryza meridionalis TaxID=40149 RepID=A0A0E0EMH9_9ORYZ